MTSNYTEIKQNTYLHQCNMYKEIFDKHGLKRPHVKCLLETHTFSEILAGEWIKHEFKPADTVKVYEYEKSE